MSLTLTTNTASSTHGEITALTPAQLVALTTSQVMALDSSQVSALRSSQVSALRSSQVSALRSSQVDALRSSQVSALRSSQVDALRSSQVEALRSSQVSALTTSQVSALSSSEVTPLHAKANTLAQAIGSFGPEVLHQPSVTQIDLFSQPSTTADFSVATNVHRLTDAIKQFTGQNQHPATTWASTTHANGNVPDLFNSGMLAQSK